MLIFRSQKDFAILIDLLLLKESLFMMANIYLIRSKINVKKYSYIFIVLLCLGQQVKEKKNTTNVAHFQKYLLTLVLVIKILFCYRHICICVIIRGYLILLQCFSYNYHRFSFFLFHILTTLLNLLNGVGGGRGQNLSNLLRMFVYFNWPILNHSFYILKVNILLPHNYGF